MPVTYSCGPKDGPVLVTGATGYVAGWVVKMLLDAGIAVHAAVRDPDDGRKVSHLHAMADAAPGTLTLFKADLLEPGSHEEAMRGCRVVMHTASPFLAPSRISDPQRDVVDPALKGTQDILETANRVDSVERIVVTGSIIAIADPQCAREDARTEADWNESPTLETGAYALSKVLAEREAWKIAAEQERWKLVVINPGFVVGPGVSASQTSASFDYFRAFVDGTYKDGVPSFDVGTVDVRDVADAHMRAAFIPEAEGRHIVFNQILSLNEKIGILKAELGEDKYSLPPDTPWDPACRHMNLDNGKSKTALGMTYRPLEPALVRMFLQAVEYKQ
ncbi:NAD-dependent epimerase/dehydratase family protein [Sphingobium sp. Sx8-8]|uniref:NAD-dependent epimerase/dehydratase family protein n=1 Tax=Sphingobium sp. Sx8-8 TaxID=2933617 RepID=UPI00247A462D|nr:NAD-dependent epimerase/dehydratase family protein [Sphingobium sp. Sx8-8]